jgi:hypothetical protein
MTNLLPFSAVRLAAPAFVQVDCSKIVELLQIRQSVIKVPDIHAHCLDRLEMIYTKNSAQPFRLS